MSMDMDIQYKNENFFTSTYDTIVYRECKPKLFIHWYEGLVRVCSFQPEHKLTIYTDRYIDVVFLFPALVVYSLTSKCTRIFILTVYGG